MSTKIYNGYRLVAGTDFWAFTERLRELGNARRDELDMRMIEAVADRAEVPEGGWPSREARLMKGYAGWSKLLREAGHETKFGDPHQFSVTFIRDPQTDRILALLYASSTMEDVFTDQPEVEPYGYWNNTDPDEDCSPAEWLEREETWERVLGMDPPVRRGINFDLRADPSDGIVEMIYRDRL